MGLRPGRCRDCRGKVLTGDSDTVAALVVRVEATPLGRQGEALALLAGRRTFTLRRLGGSWSLRPRDHWQIAGQPPRLRGDVVAEHQCSADPLPTVPTAYPPQRPQKGADDACPY